MWGVGGWAACPAEGERGKGLGLVGTSVVGDWGKGAR